MQLQTVPGNRLSAEHIEAWSALQQGHSLFESPFFRPEFCQAVASARSQVEVGVMSRHGEAVGFFPFERTAQGRACPLANILSDFHGVVADRSAEWSARHLLEECGLSAWDFHHLIPQPAFHDALWRVADSPYLDLSQGFDAYQTSRRAAGSRRIKQVERKRRQLERDIGPIHVETNCREEQAFELLRQWKSAQYRASGLTDLFAVPWISELIWKIWQHDEPEFRGRMFALFCGGRLVSLDFCMQSRHVLHSWFPCYDRQYAKYSVGHILTMEIAKAAPSLGITRIDLGKGEEEYKASFASGSIAVAEGSADRNPVRRLLRRGCHRTYRWLRSTPAREALRKPYRAARRWLQTWQLCGSH